MKRTLPWKKSPISQGIIHVRLAHWKYFHDYLDHQGPHSSACIWRGQRDAAWPLLSSLDRLLTKTTGSAGSVIGQVQQAQQLERFKQAARGRRGSNPRHDLDDNEWWALGQHHGLATPLLDWTSSPYVALYFAFEETLPPTNGERAVWALDAFHLKTTRSLTRPDMLRIVQPRQQDENARLVSQAGLFTRTPPNTSVDQWVRKKYKNERKVPILTRITIPDDKQGACVESLNKMNVNHLSLFPDLIGASRHCNWKIISVVD